jgi:hypothetical protein
VLTDLDVGQNNEYSGERVENMYRSSKGRMSEENFEKVCDVVCLTVCCIRQGAWSLGFYCLLFAAVCCRCVDSGHRP